MYHGHILINSLQRSGGSLLARLLDGHSQLDSYPFELNYGVEKVRFPAPSVARSRRVSAEDVCDDAFVAGNFGRLGRRRYFSKDSTEARPVDFAFSEFCAELRRAAAVLGGELDLVQLIDVASRVFFTMWLPSVPHESGTERWLVNHLSMSCFGDAEAFIDLFPRARLLQTVRDPYSWYASMKRHFQVADDDEIYLVFAIHLWAEATVRGLAAARLRPEHYRVVSFTRLVRETEQQLGDIADWIGIVREESLSRPTIGGAGWGGNSAFGQVVGVDERVLERGSEALTENETIRIDKLVGDLGGLLEDALGGRAGSRVSVPALGGGVSIAPAELTELYRDQAQRMALVAHGVFTRTVQRERGARYRKPVREGFVAQLRRWLFG